MAAVLIFFPSPRNAAAQALLDADGPGNTYELINSVLAPGYDVVEVPDASHPAFGRHIAEVWDSTLNRYVFEFTIHVTPDDDRGINFDRQRVEIKTYESSPDSLKGVAGETVTYRWKFRIAPGFQPSTSFTHLHQIKPVGGDDGNPLFTLTPRKGNPNRMELIHNNTTKVEVVDLSLFEGVWVECTEVVSIDPVNGSYSLTIKRVSDGSTILAYSNPKLMTMRPDNSFIRPKWGIYRSLNVPSDLRDEAVRFAGFSIAERKTGPTGVRQEEEAPWGDAMWCYPNPFNGISEFRLRISDYALVQLRVYDLLGREVAALMDEPKDPGEYTVKFNAGGLASGTYLYRLNTGSYVETRKMMLAR